MKTTPINMIINVKMINLNRQTLKLYKILDNTNKTESKKKIKHK